MPKFLAHSPEGLVDVVHQELKNLELNPIEKTPGGVIFETDWAGCYKANLWLRTSSRVVLPILNFRADDPEELYKKVREHDFTQYIDVKKTISVDGIAKNSRVFRDQRFFSLKIKDAIVDQFRDQSGERPDVGKENPDLRVGARVYGSDVTISIDTSGAPLFMRGYRREMVAAPLKETLAAGLILLTGWDQKTNLIDPMCGSGTFLIEAAMMATNIAPGLLRRGFAFQKYKNFDHKAWNKLVDEATNAERETEAKFFGFDRDKSVLSIAQADAVRAGVDHLIEFKKDDARFFEPPCEKGLIIVNPPYGERIGHFEELKDVYRDFGFSLKSRFKGWTCWVLSGSASLTEGIGLKSSAHFDVLNGPIECRFMRLQINK